MNIWEKVTDNRVRNMIFVRINKFGLIYRSTMEPTFRISQLVEKYREKKE